ncbi:MAG TPA: RDD family protein [Terriglobia bacterium]|jgi:uncharacterized RDD family membrane protein YckC
MFCPNCGKSNDDNAKFCQICGVSLQGTTPSGLAAASVVTSGPYAGFGTRFVAWLIDIIVILVGSGIVGALTFGGGAVVIFVAPWLYEAFMLSSEWQATIGKRAMSIVVTGLDGKRISFARATGRHFAKYLSAFILFIGFIMAAFTARKQALHDMIAETLVVQK